MFAKHTLQSIFGWWQLSFEFKEIFLRFILCKRNEPTKSRDLAINAIVIRQWMLSVGGAIRNHCIRLGYISLAFSSCCLFGNSMRNVILSFTHCSYVCGWRWWCCCCCRRLRRRRRPSTYPMPFVIAHSMCVSNDMYTCDARHRQRSARCRILCHSEIHGFVYGFGYCLLLLNVLYRDFLQLFFPHFITQRMFESCAIT